MDKTGLAYFAAIGMGAAAICSALVSADPKRIPPQGGGTDYVNASFTNWESAHIHPIDITPDGSTLLAVNTADNRLEVFSLASGSPVLVSEIPVGLDPISVRARTNTQAWVTNTISDSVSVVDLTSRNVIATLKTADEPSDVIFAGTPQRAFVTCSQANLVQVFNPANLAATPTNVAINGEDPRALAVSPDGQTVYAAIFNSGNATTILGGGITTINNTLTYPPNSVNDINGPYGGANPPPNSGAGYFPAVGAAGLGPRVGLIVKKDSVAPPPNAHWFDDNGHEWTAKVSGPNAADSGRLVGWDMPDRDLAVISTSSLAVTYARRLMNICMGVAVNPASGQISVIGTEATNEVRFEPNVRGRFVRVNIAMVNPVGLASTIKDLNPHLGNYAAQQLPQSERDKSLGDPRGMAWNTTGTKAYISGMGSDNVIVVNASGDRAGLAQTIAVGHGPTGVVFDGPRNRVYVLNRFDASISVVNATTETVSSTVGFFDPTPAAIKIGRKHLYDTRKTSGLGQASCGSCHIDGRMDRLAWDLGDPSGSIKQLTGQNLGANIPGLAPSGPFPANVPFSPWHPMKGPMTTQTLQDIVGKEPHHWRGDRAGIEEFNPAFVGLLGDDVELTATEMQEFENFLATITFPPNPFRNLDNTMPATLPLPDHFTNARFPPAGQPLPDGHPNAGLAIYTDVVRRIDGGGLACVTCHTLPTGAGTDTTLNLATQQFTPLATGPQGQHHLMLVSVDGSTNTAIKVPQIRNAYLKVGFETTQLESNAGFGFLHDGSVDSLARFISEPAFNLNNVQELSDLTAFSLCMSGSDLPPGGTGPLSPPAVLSNDSHAAVGVQTTLVNQATAPQAQLDLINAMIGQAQTAKVGLVIKGLVLGMQRGFMWTPTGFQSDRQSQNFSTPQLLALASPGSELTFTIVPKGSETRIGVDRDQNGVFDRDQADLACYANCDGSHGTPVLTGNDFQCFLNLYVSGSEQANCDGSTGSPTLTPNDFQCFLNKYVAGCPQ